jgi:hypothetical protein
MSYDYQNFKPPKMIPAAMAAMTTLKNISTPSAFVREAKNIFRIMTNANNPNTISKIHAVTITFALPVPK